MLQDPLRVGEAVQRASRPAGALVQPAGALVIFFRRRSVWDRLTHRPSAAKCYHDPRNFLARFSTLVPTLAAKAVRLVRDNLDPLGEIHGGHGGTYWGRRYPECAFKR